MLHWNAQWRLDVDVTNVTAAYAGVNLAGPRSREVLAKLCHDVDLSAPAFPYMGVRLGTVAGIRARLLRVGFVGELGYEIHVPASQGEALWDALMEAGEEGGIRPFGVEAQRVLRLEKGHIIIGQDTDGLTYPQEADMAWAIARNKPYFMGGRAIAIQAARPLTRKLVGFALADPQAPVPEECHLDDPRRRYRRPRHLGRALALSRQDRRPRLCRRGSGEALEAGSISGRRAAGSLRPRSCRFRSMIPKTSARRCETWRRP